MQGAGAGVLLHGGGGNALRVPPPLPSGAGDAAEDAGVAYLIRFGLDEVRRASAVTKKSIRSVVGGPLPATDRKSRPCSDANANLLRLFRKKSFD